VPPGSQQQARGGPLPYLSGRDGQGKLASQVAARIVDDVIARGWPVGEVIGASDDFLQQYDISRAVFREAVRLLEHQQVARTRRGPGGGLVVVEPSVDAIIDAAVLYLYRVDARVEEVFEARTILEEIVIELVPDRLDEDGRAQLRDLIGREKAGEEHDRQAMHALLATLTGNPALALFVEILNRVSILYLRKGEEASGAISDRVHRAHRRITGAVLDGKVAQARDLLRRHLAVEVEILERRRATRRMLPSAVALRAPAGRKRAEQVAREILLGVTAGRLEPGQLLGSEPELMERHGVSRAVLREAVRLLEHHQIAAMRRGPGGGLFVAAPSSGAVADVVALYLARQGTEIAALAELRIRIEVALVELTIDRLDDAGRAFLDEVVELGEGDEDPDIAIHNLHAAVASLAGNRVLELLALVLIRLTRFHQYDADLTPEAGAEVTIAVNRAHIAIARAVQSGDRATGQRRMRRHLEALATHLH
jgi:DNA-binding FadR family transcriptional regulator